MSSEAEQSIETYLNSRAEAAKFLGISVGSIELLMRNGLPYVEVPVTTDRIRNECGTVVGGPFNVKHKESSTAWGATAVDIEVEKPSKQDV